MIPVLASNYKQFRSFLIKYNLSPKKYYYLDTKLKIMGIERGSLLLMYESYKSHPNYHDIIREARFREMDCIQVL